MQVTSAKPILDFPSGREKISSECLCKPAIDTLPSLEYDEDAFTRILALERKRSERSKRPFLLLLLSLARIPADENGRDTRQKLLSSLSSSKRDTDVLGWYRSGWVIGIIFTEICKSCNGAVSQSVIDRISSNMATYLEPEVIEKIEVSVYHFPEKLNSDGSATQLALYPEIRQNHDAHKKSLLLKRVIDIVGSLVALILSAPIFVVLSVLIKLTSEGPVFFRQERVGQYGKTFTFLKFRSMHVNNDPSIHREYVKSLIEASDNGSHNGDPHKKEVFKIQDDPRVTPIGKFLRKTSLDELPQFFNVLMGSMSLVGPRPPIPYELENYDLWHMRRVLDMRPGITGMWQVEGRSSTTFNEMVRLDIYYMTNWSMWLDLKILFRTPMVVLASKGAY